jgi:anti-sigma-K factor RskA
MSCRRFQNYFHEYLDGALSVRAQGAAERHLARCGACRQTLLREQRVAQVLAQRLRGDAESLVLRPDLWHRVVERIEPTQNRPVPLDSAAEFWARWAWPMVISASLLVIIGLTVWLPFSAARSRERAAANAKADTHPSAISARVSYSVPVHTFRQYGNSVVDTVAFKTAVADETIWSASQADFREN